MPGSQGFNPPRGFSASQSVAGAPQRGRTQGFNPPRGFSASQSGDRQAINRARCDVSIRRADSQLPKVGWLPSHRPRDARFQSAARILSFPKLCSSCAAIRSRREFQSAARILSFPKCAPPPGSYKYPLSFNPPRGFSASQRSYVTESMIEPCTGFNPPRGFSASQRL